MSSATYLELVMVFLVSLSLTWFIIFFHRRSKHLQSRLGDLQAVQAAHTSPVPRVGGIAVFAALVFGILIILGEHLYATFYVKLLLSSLPIFVVGLSEDLGFFASPRLRLLATALSGLVFVVLLGQWLPKTGLTWIDMPMKWAPFAIGFSLFVGVGVCHAFNLIDGVNGFSALIGISASLALAAISHQQGLIDHRDTLIILGVSIAGFLVFNFPFGRIFLGDAGAYLIGHILVWIAISILWMAPQVSPFAVLLIFFWPIADTFLAIVRRLMYGTSVSKPDRLHFHQLVMRTLQITFLGRNQRRLANPLTTIIMLPFAMCPIISGVLLSLDNIKAAIAVIVYFLLFGSTYYVNRLVVLKLRGVIKV